MHQMIIKDIATSTTFDCYFAQFFDGITSGATSSIEIMLVGATGNSITGGFDRFAVRSNSWLQMEPLHRQRNHQSKT